MTLGLTQPKGVRMYLTPKELTNKPEAFRIGYRDGLNNVTHDNEGPYPLSPEYTHYWDGYQAAKESLENA